MAHPRGTIQQWFWNKVDQNGTNGCWIWNGCFRGFYGKAWDGNKTISAHRLAYIISKGPIAEGLVIHHRCENKACVNPEHLEAVSTLENVRFGAAMLTHPCHTFVRAPHQPKIATVAMAKYDTIETRFWKHVTKNSKNGCWLWRGSMGPHYGQVWNGERLVLAHVFAYELLRGPKPDGMVLDHLCRNKRCVNPQHLEAVTQAENVRRWAETKTHCKHGHAYAEGDYRIYKNARICLKCERANARCKYATHRDTILKRSRDAYGRNREAICSRQRQRYRKSHPMIPGDTPPNHPSGLAI